MNDLSGILASKKQPSTLMMSQTWEASTSVGISWLFILSPPCFTHPLIENKSDVLENIG